MRELSFMNRLLSLVLILILAIVGFVLFFPLDFIINQPVGIVSEMIFPGSGAWLADAGDKETGDVFSRHVNNTVSIIIDEWGVPHIYAEDEHDLCFATGYIHSRDRYFQMDMTRRMARGLLSEIIGERGLESDRFHLALGMEYWSERTLEDMKKDKDNSLISGLLDSYSLGVNEYIRNNRDNVSLEYVLMGIDPGIRKWGILDTMVFSKVMARMLSWSYSDFQNTKSLEAFGEEKIRQYLSEAFYQIPVIDGYGEWKNHGKEGHKDLQTEKAGLIASLFLEAVESLPFEKQYSSLEPGGIIGSNNWAVNGHLSATGSSLLCNDMHLARTVPIIWYETHLVNSREGLNLYGYTLPGVPFPITGFNDSIAWGFTNTGFDVIDWYYYESPGEESYLLEGEEREFDCLYYDIPVRNKKTHRLKVRHTVDGPVLSDVLDLDVPGFSGSKPVIVPKWTANAVTYELKAVYGFGNSKSIGEFQEASRNFSNPAQNFLFADRDNIGMRPTGLVPVREEGTGAFLNNGSEGEGKWTGFVPFEELPFLINPERGFLFSANQATVGPDYGYVLQNSWDESYRPRRIHRMLSDTEMLPFDHEYMMKIQLDTFSVPAESFMPFILESAERYVKESGCSVSRRTYEILSGWDFFMDRESPAPSIYKAWENIYRKRVFGDEYESYGIHSYPMLGFLEYITCSGHFQEWFDDISTPDRIETRDDIITDSFIKALDFLKKVYGTDDPDKWIWGDVHRVIYPHIGSVPGFEKGPYPADGDGLTVNPAPFTFSENPRPGSWGASQRLIADLAEPENSLTCIPGGQSGRISSRTYSNQLEDLFFEGKYRKVKFYENMDEFPIGEISQFIRIIPRDRGINIRAVQAVSAIIYLLMATVLFILYLRHYMIRNTGLLIILLFLVITLVYTVGFLGLEFWKMVFFSIIFFNMFLATKKGIYRFSVLTSLFAWLGYLAWAFYFTGALFSLKALFYALSGSDSAWIITGIIILSGIYCGILCAVISIIFRKIFYRSFRG